MGTKYSFFNIMLKFKSRLSKYITTYLDTRVIYAMDVLLSVLASFVAMLLTSFFTPYDIFTREIASIWILTSVLFSIVAFYVFKSYRVAIRHTSIQDIPRGFFSVLLKDVLMAGMLFLCVPYDRNFLFTLFADLFITFFFNLGIRFSMVFVYYMMNARFQNYYNNRTRVMVFGVPDKVASLITRLANSSRYQIVGALSPNPSDKNIKVSGVHIYTYESEETLNGIIGEHSANAVLFASERDVRENRPLVEYCVHHHVKILIVPSVDEFVNSKNQNKIREVKIEDLLGRPEIEISLNEIKENLKEKVVMVTGAAGSIGSELCRQIAAFGITKLVLYDNAETPMHNLRLELEERFPYLDFVPVIGDVRSEARLDFVFVKYRPQIVFHAAAYKHVPLMEENPCEAVLVNVVGSRNVAERCVKYGVEKMVMISTDKAVNPTNVMGCTKRLAEIYVQSLGLSIQNGTFSGLMQNGEKPKTKFVTTRFGNVLGSNGSVIPRFRQQIEKGGPVTVTHPDITRFFMTIPEACRLVMEAATMSNGNEIFVFDMGVSVKIDHLARRMISLAGFEPDKDIEIVYTGLRPGEKLYEEVLANTEHTVPTRHNRIRVAEVREYLYDDAVKASESLESLAKAVRINDMVSLMKKVVPEFKSKNSEFEKLDM